MILNNVPVIDIAPSFLDSQGKQAVSDSIRVACEDVGFFTITGHGVSPDEINRTRQAAISFFALDLEEKLKISQPSEKISRGYSKVGEGLWLIRWAIRLYQTCKKVLLWDQLALFQNPLGLHVLRGFFICPTSGQIFIMIFV